MNLRMFCLATLTGAAVSQAQPIINWSDQKVFDGGSASFVVQTNSAPSWTLLNWQESTNGYDGAYVSLKDGGNISGSQTTTLTINPATFADAADYRIVASNGSASATNYAGHLYVYSTKTDVSQPGDRIFKFGDTTGDLYTHNDPALLINDSIGEGGWINGGSGPNTAAGFPPFAGPVGIVLTPFIPSTILTGLRFYSGFDSEWTDPNGFVLEGSNDQGSNYVVIASSPLSLPLDRNWAGAPVDPTIAEAQEILFSNSLSFSSYRLTFPSTRDSARATFLELSQVELLGLPSQIQFVTTAPAPGYITLSGWGGRAGQTYELLTRSDLTAAAGWSTNLTGVFDENGRFTVSLPINATGPNQFFRFRAP